MNITFVFPFNFIWIICDDYTNDSRGPRCSNMHQKMLQDAPRCIMCGPRCSNMHPPHPKTFRLEHKGSSVGYTGHARAASPSRAAPAHSKRANERDDERDRGHDDDPRGHRGHRGVCIELGRFHARPLLAEHETFQASCQRQEGWRGHAHIPRKSPAQGHSNSQYYASLRVDHQAWGEIPHQRGVQGSERRD